MAKIEVLYPEICNLFGNLYNIKYLEQSNKEIQIIYTKLNDEPKFVTEDIDMIYMAPMTEKSQEIVISKLQNHKEKIQELINNNKIFLLIGNALEIFGQYIENEDGTRIEALNITGLYAKRNMLSRHNSMFLGEFDDMEIVGFKSQFSMSYGKNDEGYLFKVKKGIGICDDSRLEGIRINNFMGTYLLGPILVLNPLFTKYILQLLGLENNKLIFEEEAMNCYNIRLKEMEKLEF